MALTIINSVLDYLLPFHSLLSYIGVAVGSCISVFVYLWHLFPHEMLILDPRLIQHPEQLDRVIKRVFREEAYSPPTTTYRENVPQALTWNEARVQVTRLPRSIRVTGPGTTLSWLRKRLAKILRDQPTVQ